MKGFVFLYGSEVLLRFVQTGAFKELEKKHDITYIALASSVLMKDGGVEHSLVSSLANVEWIPFYPNRFEKWCELFDISCIRYQERSISFQIRYQETIRQSPERIAGLEKLASPEIYDSHRAAVEKDMGLHPDMLKLTLALRPDFFVLPSALLDYVTDDVLQLANAIAIPTLMLVAGWDNLSSKGLIYHQPSTMGVWGEQSRQHAIQIQGSEAQNVHVIGAPHYEDFYNNPLVNRAALRKEFGVPPEKRTILFAGSYRTFDETELLKQVDNAIDQGILPDIHVIYRPHPWRATRQTEDNFLDQTWKHVTMDSEMVEAYQAVKKGAGGASPDNFLFRLNHLAQLYQSVDAVISPMSTVLLEALMFDLPTMAVAFGDGKHSWSADKASRMTHFKEFFEIPDLIVCRQQNVFLENLNLLISYADGQSKRKFDQDIQHFVYRDNKRYADRVLDLVTLMLETNNSKIPYDIVDVKPGKTFKSNRAQKILARFKKIGWKALRLLKK